MAEFWNPAPGRPYFSAIRLIFRYAQEVLHVQVIARLAEDEHTLAPSVQWLR